MNDLKANGVKIVSSNSEVRRLVARRGQGRYYRYGSMLM